MLFYMMSGGFAGVHPEWDNINKVAIPCRTFPMSLSLSSPTTGHFLIAFSLIFFVFGSYAVLFSALLPLTGVHFLDLLAKDAHYKYFTLLFIPATSYFVIANWVGWQYYRNS